MSETVGYVVVDFDGRPMWLEAGKRSADRFGVLWLGLATTIFATRNDARNAIARTNDYAHANGLARVWKTDYRILRATR